MHTSVQLVHKEGFPTAPAHFRTKKSSREPVARVIDGHDVRNGPEWPQGKPGTGGGGAEVPRLFLASKISFWMVGRPPAAFGTPRLREEVPARRCTVSHG